jgi:hypothetical protein
MEVDPGLTLMVGEQGVTHRIKHILHVVQDETCSTLNISRKAASE